MGEKGNVAAGSGGVLGAAADVGEEAAGFVAGAVGAGVSAAVAEEVKGRMTEKNKDEQTDGTAES